MTQRANNRKTGNTSTVTVCSPSLPVEHDQMHRDVTFNGLDTPGHIDVQVAGFHQGLVQLSVVLPEELLNGFVQFFEGSFELFKASARKTRYLRIQQNVHKKADDLSERERIQKLQEDFDKKVCSIFDALRREGVGVREAIKKTNSALKAENYPHSTYELVICHLRAVGKLRNIGFYKKSK
jgi:hypothetical protein